MSRSDVSLDVTASLGSSIGGLKIGVDRSFLGQHLADRRLSSCFEEALSVLVAEGATLVDISIPHYAALAAASTIGWPSEAMAIHRSNLQTRWDDYGRPTRLTIAVGALVSSADYVQAQRVRRVGARAIGQLLRTTCDVIATPTTSIGAPPIEGLDFDDLAPTVFCEAWNSVGFPAISVPMGFGERGLPLGLQLVGPLLSDPLVIQVADAYQRRTDWHLRRAELVA